MASAGLAIATLLLVAWNAHRTQPPSAAPWSLVVIDIGLVTVPLIGAVVIAAFLSQTPMLRATGMDHWMWTDALLGIGVAALARAAVELIAPTVGTLGGPFDVADADVGIARAASVLAAVLISPVVEEMFFRGLVQRALADAMRRSGRVAASALAILVSTIAFTGLHVAASPGAVTLTATIGTVGVGFGCGVATAVTGRLGAAVVAHTAFNASGAILLVT